MATNSSPDTFNLWKEFVESTAGESLENFVEGQVKLHGSKTGDIVHGILAKYGRFLKNKTLLLLVGNALAAGLVKVLGVRNPDAARVLYAAVRHLAGGATEGAAETLKSSKDDASWDHAVKDAVHLSMADPAGLPKIPGGALSVYTHPAVAYGHRFDPAAATTFCDVLGVPHRKHLMDNAGRTKVVKVPSVDPNTNQPLVHNGRPILVDQTIADPMPFAVTKHDLFEFVKGMDNRLCPSCFPHGAPEKPAEKKEPEPKGRKDKYGTEVMNVITAAKNRLAKQLLGYAPKEDDLPLLEKYSFKLVDFLRATEKLPEKSRKSAPHLAEALKVPDLKHLEDVARDNWTPKFHETLDFKDAEEGAFHAWDTAVHMLVKGHEFDQERKNPTLHKAKPFLLRTAAKAAWWSATLFVLFVIGWSAAGLRLGGSFDTSAIGLYVALGSGLALTLIVIAGLLPVELIAAIGDVLLKDKNRIDDTVKSVRQTLMITLGVLTIAVIPAHLAQMPFWWYFPLFVLLLMASMAGTAALEKALAFETLRRSRHMLGLALGTVVIVTLASLTVQALRKLHPDAAAAIEAKAADLAKKDDAPAASQTDASTTQAAGDTQEQLNAQALADLQKAGAAPQPSGKQAEAAGKPKSKAELERLLKLVEDYKKATAENDRLQNRISKLEGEAEAETDPQKRQKIEDARNALVEKQKMANDEAASLQKQFASAMGGKGLPAFEKELRDELKALQGADKPSVAKENGSKDTTKDKAEDKPQVASSASLSVEAYCKGLPNKFRVGKCEKYKG